MKITKVFKNKVDQWRVSWSTGTGFENRKHFRVEAEAIAWGESVREPETPIDEITKLGVRAHRDLLNAHQFAVSKSEPSVAGMLYRLWKTAQEHVQLLDQLHMTQATHSVKTVGEVYASMMGEKSNPAQGLQPVSVNNVRSVLSRFVECEYLPLREKTPISAITSEMISKWIYSISSNPWTVKGYRININTMFNYAILHGWVIKNPVALIPVPKTDGTAPGILTVEETEKLFRTCETHDPSVLTALTLMAFLGIRPGEVLKMEPHSVMLKRRLVEVTAKVSKTRQRRHVTIPENAAAWLAKGGPLVKLNLKERVEAVREAAGVPFEKRWPHDALRHSFCSYHLAYPGHRAADTQEEMGHRSSELIYRNYRELVFEEDAIRWFNIMPTPQN